MVFFFASQLNKNGRKMLFTLDLYAKYKYTHVY